MGIEVEIEGGSEEAVAFALLKLVARAEGKLDGKGEIEDADRRWILDTYAECLLCVLGEREVGPRDDEEDDDDEDDEEDGSSGPAR